MCCRYYVNAGTYEAIERITGSSFPGIRASGIRTAGIEKAGIQAGGIRTGDTRTGDIHPSDSAPVLAGSQGRLVPISMTWGFVAPSDRESPTGSKPSPAGGSSYSHNPSSAGGSSHSGGYFPSAGRLLINARAETLLERRTFAPLAANFRCIVPAAWFYEWNAQKEKVRFLHQSSQNSSSNCLQRSSQNITSVLFMAGIFLPDPKSPRFVIVTTAANESMLPVHDRMPLIFSEKMARQWILDPSQTKHLLSIPSPLLEREQEYQQLSFF